MELEKTVDFMLSPDYKDRMKAEYWQTKERYERLKKYNTKLAAQRIAGGMREVLGEGKTPLEVLERQQSAMGEYLHLLELRAVLEGVELEEDE